MKKFVINKKDLINNINIIKKLADKKEIIAMVKFNGYGLGLEEYIKILINENISFFATDNAKEAIKIRKINKNIKILNVSSTCLKEEITNMLDNNIIMTVGSIETAKIINDISKERNIIANCHIKIDTGFGRYGFIYNDLENILKALRYNNINYEGIFSHFSNSYYDKKYTYEQFNKFNKVIEYLTENKIEFKIKHICNSSAFLLYKDMHMDAVRIGSAFLGRIPIINNYGLKKIGYLECEVSEIKILPKNFNIGYSNTYKTKKETKIAILQCGSIDGINITSNSENTKLIDKIMYVYRGIKKIFKTNFKYVKINDKKYKILSYIDQNDIIIEIDNNINIGDIAIIDINPLYLNKDIEIKYI